MDSLEDSLEQAYKLVNASWVTRALFFWKALPLLRKTLVLLARDSKLTSFFAAGHGEPKFKEMARGGRRSGRRNFAFFFIDLDNFKSTNEILTHAGADEVLRYLASVIADVLRSTDVCIRFGGDELVILATGMPQDRAMGIADEIRRKLSEYEFVGKNTTLRQTATIAVIHTTEKRANEVGYSELCSLSSAAVIAGKKENGAKNKTLIVPLP